MVSMPYDAGIARTFEQAEKQVEACMEQQRREIVTGIMSVAPGRSLDVRSP